LLRQQLQKQHTTLWNGIDLTTQMSMTATLLLRLGQISKGVHLRGPFLPAEK
jgi:hypothetical protein